jgi:hypothetical protein
MISLLEFITPFFRQRSTLHLRISHPEAQGICLICLHDKVSWNAFLATAVAFLFLAKFHVSIPSRSTTTTTTATAAEPTSIARVRDLLSSLKFKPNVVKIVPNICLAQMWNDVRFFMGKDAKSGIESRYLFSSGCARRSGVVEGSLLVCLFRLRIISISDD